MTSNSDPLKTPLEVATEALSMLPFLLNAETYASMELNSPDSASTELSLGEPLKIFHFQANNLLADKLETDDQFYSQAFPILREGKAVSSLTIFRDEADRWEVDTVGGANYIVDAIAIIKFREKHKTTNFEDCFIASIPAIKQIFLAHIEGSTLYFTHLYDLSEYQFKKNVTQPGLEIIQKLKPLILDAVNSFPPSG